MTAKAANDETMAIMEESNRSVTRSGADQKDSLDMARLAAGHDAALNDLMERHAEKLFQYLVRSLQNEDDAAGLAQETFVRVYQNRKKFDAGERFSTWLYAMASKLARDRHRWRARQVSLAAGNEAAAMEMGESFPQQNLSPSEAVQSHERSETVRRAVAALPEQLRIPLILSQYGEKSHAEIGEILGCSAKAVEARLDRAWAQLREKTWLAAGTDRIRFINFPAKQPSKRT